MIYAHFDSDGLCFAKGSTVENEKAVSTLRVSSDVAFGTHIDNVTGDLVQTRSLTVDEPKSRTDSLIEIEKIKKRDAINQHCKSEIEKGFFSSALSSSHFYSFNLEDQSNFQATFLFAKEFNVARPFKCIDQNGVSSYREHTFAQLVQVGIDADTHKMACLFKAHTLKEQLKAATTLEEVKEIQWT